MLPGLRFNACFIPLNCPKRYDTGKHACATLMGMRLRPSCCYNERRKHTVIAAKIVMCRDMGAGIEQRLSGFCLDDFF